MVTNLPPCKFCGGKMEDMDKYVQCTSPKCERIDPDMREHSPEIDKLVYNPTHCRHRACRKELSPGEESYLKDECIQCNRKYDNGWGIEP